MADGATRAGTTGAQRLSRSRRELSRMDPGRSEVATTDPSQVRRHKYVFASTLHPSRAVATTADRAAFDVADALGAA